MSDDRMAVRRDGAEDDVRFVGLNQIGQARIRVDIPFLGARLGPVRDGFANANHLKVIGQFQDRRQPNLSAARPRSDAAEF